VFEGALWLLLARGATVVAQFGALLVLARYLRPEEFGLAGMVAVAIGVVGVAADLGMETAAVRPGADDRRAATLSANAGIACAVALMLAAPLVARLFGSPAGLVELLAAGSAGLVFSGFAAPARARVRRALRFRQLAALDLARAMVAAGAAVGFASRGHGAWALVLADLVAGGVAAASLWLFAPAMGGGSGGRLLGDGLRIVGTRLLDACFAQADRFFVGRRLGEAALGLYGFAARHALLPLQHALPVADQVALPVLARERGEGLVRGYLSLTRWIALAVVPFSALLFVTAPWLVEALYPGRWQAAVPALRALCVAAAAAGLNSDPGILWLALGLTRLRFWWSALNVPLIAIVVWIGARHGITGVAWALAARSLMAAAAAQVICRRVAGVPHVRYVQALAPGALVGALVGALGS
jgi:O-antigen/teichoic acid export membrane protein